MAVLWLILKGILWLLALTLLLLVVALLVPITAELCYEKGEFTAAVRVLLLRFRVYPFPEPKEPKKDGFFAKIKAKIKPKKTAAKPEKSKQDIEQSSPPDNGQQYSPMQKQPPQNARQQAQQQKEPPRNKPPQPEQKSPQHAPAPSGKKNKKAGQKFLWSLDTIRSLVVTAGSVVRKILAGLLIHDIRIVLPVQMDDAASTAVAVGGVHAALHASLGVLNNFFRLKFKQLVIIPDYQGEYEGQEHFSCKITTHLIIMVVIAVWAFVRLKQEKIIG